MKDMINTNSYARKGVSFLAGLALAGVASVQAAVPAEIQAIVTDTTSLFDDVKTYVIAVVVFGILIAVVKMLKRK